MSHAITPAAQRILDALELKEPFARLARERQRQGARNKTGAADRFRAAQEARRAHAQRTIQAGDAHLLRLAFAVAQACTRSASHSNQSLYVLRAVGYPAVKVGVSVCIADRVRQLSGACPMPLEVAAAWEMQSADTLIVERAAHAALRDMGLQGNGGSEWFRAPVEQVCEAIALGVWTRELFAQERAS